MYTQNPTIGAKYEETKNLDIKEIAKLVRSEIKEKFPELKTSVKIERYAGGQSLNVIVKESPTPLKNPLYDDSFVWDIRVGKVTSWSEADEIKRVYMTEYGTQVEEGVKNIVEQYNYNDSDAMIDWFNVNFYSHVRIEC